MTITRLLIATNVAIFALQAVYNDALISVCALWPIGRYHVEDLHAVVGFEPWQLITYAFLHANLAHIGLNMWALFLFGRDVERTLGARHYILLYFAAVVSAAIVQLAAVAATRQAGIYPTIGASGGIFGVLLAFGVLYPRRTVMLLFPPIPMPAWLLVILKFPEDAHTKSMSTFEKVEHLRTNAAQRGSKWGGRQTCPQLRNLVLRRLHFHPS
jgi:membrane associated rhomboid family serine protease